VFAAVSQATHLFSDVAGHTTAERVLKPDSGSGYTNLHSEPVTPVGGSCRNSQDYVLRDGTCEADSRIPDAQAGRENRRRSISYFGQLTDFQLADEESPGRVEFLDPGASAAWRPQEALQPFIIDWSLRQLDQFVPASPIAQGDGTRAHMDFALMTGDQADSQQRDELLWTRALLEGGTSLNFNSGSTNPNDYDPTVHPGCANFPPNAANRAEALRYTGVQDYDDTQDQSSDPLYYDPDVPRGQWATWPMYTGLMDRAQQLTITPQGVDVPTYVTNGNHDSLVQGNEDAVEGFEDISTSCVKALASTVVPGPGILDPNVLFSPSRTMLVPPDPARRYVNRPQIRQIYAGNDRDNAHGYGFVDADQLKASCPVDKITACMNDTTGATARTEGAASYYAWDPSEAPGFRFISLDTVAEGGQTAEGARAVCGTADGNIDDPQFQWLKGELDRATQRNQLIVIFGHHPVRSMCADIPDENAQPCTTRHSHVDENGDPDVPQHHRDPGCDLDPRPSTPLHLGVDPQPGDPRQSFTELLSNYSHVIAYVSGHTHQNAVRACGLTTGCPAGSGIWWEINTSATADWPVQHRLVEIMDNRDGTLSLFGTVLDAAAASHAPDPQSAAAFDGEQLATIGRVLAYNDPQEGGGNGREGAPKDQNVELLVRDPRIAYPRPKGATPVLASLVPAFKQCASPNSSHGAPLTNPSCNPPTQESSRLTVGSPDANGQPAKSAGQLRLDTINGNPSTSTDEADVSVRLNITDVREQSDLSDYTGELEGTLSLRITDKANGGSATDPGTATDLEFAFSAPCQATPDTTVGSTCAVTTTADAVVPGAVTEGDRAIWELGQVNVFDGGDDGVASTHGDNKVFARQGIFVP
jgi:hypothetical protein